MAIEDDLPVPGTPDVWGDQLNTVIESVDSKAEAAAALAATNVSTDGVDTSGNLTLNYGENSTTLLRASAVGAANGVASLDGVKQIPVAQMGKLGYADVGAAAAVHQHSLGDLPQVQLAVNAAPAVAVFNTTTQQWPLRTSITDSPTRTVIWMGDADIPTYALPGVDFFYGPRKSGTTTTTPTPPDPPTATPDANGVTLSVPVVTVNGSAYNITANVTTNSNLTFTYLQLAVRGPNGEAQDTGYNPGAVVNTATLPITGSGTATSVGNWTVRLAYNITGGAAQTDWIDGPSVTFAIADLGGVPTDPGNGTPGSGVFPVLNRSGMAWNSGVCDASNGNVAACEAFGTWRGRPNDAIMFFPSRGSFDEMAIIPDGLTSWPGYRVIAVPSQPTNLQNNYTAAGSANAFWLNYGLLLKNKGWNDGRTVLRLNWEPNGNWYAWAWQNGGAATFVQAFKNVVNNVRVNCPTIKIDLCLNRGNVNGGVDWSTQIVDPLIGWIDILGVDNYDFSPPSFNQSQFDSMANINPGLNSIAAKCRAKGIKMSIDEWGVCSTVSSFPGGFDNPFYITAMRQWMSANTDVFALDMYFNINADGLNQRLYPVSESSKPNSGVRYQQEF